MSRRHRPIFTQAAQAADRIVNQGIQRLEEKIQASLPFQVPMGVIDRVVNRGVKAIEEGVINEAETLIPTLFSKSDQSSVEAEETEESEYPSLKSLHNQKKESGKTKLQRGVRKSAS